MFLKNLIRDYLSFTKKDRIGLLALILLILVIYLLPRFFAPGSKTLAIKDLDGLKPAIDTLMDREAVKDKADSFEKVPEHARRLTENFGSELFSFDPNTLSPEGW